MRPRLWAESERLSLEFIDAHVIASGSRPWYLSRCCLSGQRFGIISRGSGFTRAPSGACRVRPPASVSGPGAHARFRESRFRPTRCGRTHRTETAERSRGVWRPGLRKGQWPFKDRRNGQIHVERELLAESGLLLIVPISRFEELGFRLRPKDQPTRHGRFKSFRRTSSQGSALRGSARCSSSRRSNSAACSRVRANSAPR